MAKTPSPESDKTPREKLAELVAQRKAAGGGAPGQRIPGQKTVERAAAANAASKSRPAPRKG